MTRPARGGVAAALLTLAGLGLAGCASDPGPTAARSGPTVTAGAASPGTTGSPSASPDAGSGTAPGAAAVPGPQPLDTGVPAALRPVRVTIPAIGVDARLVNLGVAKDGTIEVPTDFATPGWLRTGPAPGQRGPAVIAGHVDSKRGPAVFYRLRELHVGDAVRVRRADGSTVAFSVDDVEQYPKDHFPTADVYGPVPGPVLRLITCGGTFDRAVGHYRDNVVVYAS